MNTTKENGLLISFLKGVKSSVAIASFPGSPHLEGGEPGTFYHVCDVKGRHDLIMRGSTKLGTHAHSRTSVSRPLQSFFFG